MTRSPAGRWLPLAALVAVQLLIIAVAPSKAPDQAVASSFDPSGGGTPGLGEGSYVDPNVGEAVTDDGTGSIDAGSPTTDADGSGGPGGAPGATVAPGQTPSTSGTAGGDTSHCVGDRQFDPAIDFYAPPCVGRSDGTNPGATYQGVTADEITIVRYYGQGSAAVDAILRAQGTYVSIDQYRTYFEKAQEFINANYELYGRKVRLEVFEGNCTTIPPDVSCLRSEMRQLVESKKPFAVQWRTTLCSACFEELSKLHTINIGGINFRDAFGQQWRPYHYDASLSGTRAAQHNARWFCAQLAGKPAVYARSQQYQDDIRRIGVISTNDPQNQQAVEIDFKAELAKCGQDYGNRKYFYEQDITTADQQRRAGVLAMRGNAADLNDDATTVFCFCDSVAPAFLYQEEDTQQYYPENIVPGTGNMDRDAASQAYIGTVGCPQGSPCSFEGAFGLQSNNEIYEKFKGPGHLVWQAGGGEGPAPFEAADDEWDYFNLLASAIQMAGPNLTPETFEQGAFRLGARGDENHALRQISPGNYHWTQDVQPVYWSSTKTSAYNGEVGTYVRVGGRVRVDGWKPGDFTLPAMPR